MTVAEFAAQLADELDARAAEAQEDAHIYQRSGLVAGRDLALTKMRTLKTIAAAVRKAAR